MRFQLGPRQVGDTIVEVLIVLTVLGMALSISYATANRSLLSTRQAEENSYVGRQVQAQVEALYVLASSGDDNPSDPAYSNPNNVYSQIATFCIPTTSSNPISTSCTINSSFDYTIVIYNCDAYQNHNGEAHPCSDDSISSPSDSFVVLATWDDVAGAGKDTIKQVYRVHP